MDKKAIHILIADDSKTVCSFISNILSKVPFNTKIATAHTGEECLKLLSSEKCDIAFVDVHMPDMTGLEALKLSRERGGKALTVIMSSEIDDEKRQISRDSGAYEYLKKPIIPKDVTAILLNYLRFNKLSDVLIVDDSSTVRKVMKRILADSVFKMLIREAKSGLDAIQEIETGAPDVLFLDINMPDLDGLTVLKKLAEKEIVPKTILMTSDKSIEFNPEIESLGVTHLLYKPFFSEDVDRVIHDIFNLRPTSLQHMEKVMTLQAKEIAKGFG